jgi:hypothetical protein
MRKGLREFALMWHIPNSILSGKTTTGCVSERGTRACFSACDRFQEVRLVDSGFPELAKLNLLVIRVPCG